MTITPVIALLCVAGGYVGSIFTWPYIRAAVLGVEAEVKLLHDRAAAIIKAAKGQ